MFYFEHAAESYHQMLQLCSEKYRSKIEDNYVTVNPELGEGFIKYIPVLDGVEVLISNFRLWENALYRRKRIKQKNLILRIDELDEAKRLIINSDDGGHTIHSIGTYFFVASTIVDYEVYVPASVYSKNIHVLFSENFLAGQLKGGEKSLLIQYLNMPYEKQFIPLNAELEKLYGEIMKIPVDDGLYDVKTTSRTLNMIEELFAYFRYVLDESKPDHEHDLHEEDIERLQKVEKMIIEHYTEDLPPVDELAKEVAMSTSTLQRKFKKMFNLGIYEYYQHYRLQEARRMLLVNNMHAKEVAYKLGFKDPSHFSRAYKKQFGFTPSQTA